jgi:DNA repair protein RadC
VSQHSDPEGDELYAVLRDDAFVDKLTRAPGGWRTLSEHELDEMQLTVSEVRAVLALQELTSRSYPSLEPLTLAMPADVGRVYGHRLGGARQERMIAIALDGRHRVLQEIEVARGGSHGVALTTADVLRPLIRAGAKAFIILHNHPSGDPTPSAEDIVFTQALAAAADIVGVTLVDHVIVGAGGGGWVSMYERGEIDVAA